MRPIPGLVLSALVCVVVSFVSAPGRTLAQPNVRSAHSMQAYANFDDYLEDQRPKNQVIIRALRKFVKGVAPALDEAVKWGNGCWVGPNGPVAYVYSDTGYVQFGFFHGASLKDPRGLLEGKGRYVRHIKVHDASDIDKRAFGALLKQAVDLPIAAAPAKGPR